MTPCSNDSIEPVILSHFAASIRLVLKIKHRRTSSSLCSHDYSLLSLPRRFILQDSPLLTINSAQLTPSPWPSPELMAPTRTGCR